MNILAREELLTSHTWPVMSNSLTSCVVEALSYCTGQYSVLNPSACIFQILQSKRKWNWLSDFQPVRGGSAAQNDLSWLTPIRRVILLKLDFRGCMRRGGMNMSEHGEFINEWSLKEAYVMCALSSGQAPDSTFYGHSIIICAVGCLYTVYDNVMVVVSDSGWHWCQHQTPITRTRCSLVETLKVMSLGSDP